MPCIADGMRLCHCAACWLQCYWFYRAREVPETAWEGVKRKKYKGAEYSLSKKKKLRQEEFCERQVGRWGQAVPPAQSSGCDTQGLL